MILVVWCFIGGNFEQFGWLIRYSASRNIFRFRSQQLEASFDNARFNTSMSFIAVEEDQVIGRIDASVIASRSDASCCSAYLDWICVLKSERHRKVAQALLTALRTECKAQGVGMLIALMADNDEAQRFYRSVEGASIHDTGIWMVIQ